MKDCKAKELMGPYSKYVERLRQRKPSLSYLCRFLTTPASVHCSCRIVSLGFFEGRKAPVKTELAYDELYSTLTDDELATDSDPEDETWHERGRLQGRLLLIEDLDKKTLEMLGSLLDIDPVFFAGHLHLPWTPVESQGPEQCILPSQARRQPFINICHHRTVLFDKITPPARRLRRRVNIDRKAVISPLSEDQHVGIVQHCTSVLIATRKTHWIGLILVDRHVDGQYLYSPQKGDPLKSIHMSSRIFLGGYEDFLDSPSMSDLDGKEPVSPDRKGFFDDLILYWSVQSPESLDPANPTLPSLAYYPLKIVAAEWVKYGAIMFRAIKQFEYSTSITNVRDELDKLNSDMRALQRWRRRSMASEHKVHSVIRMLNAHPHSSDSSSLIEDYDAIFATITGLGRRLESMLPVVTSLVSIIDSRRAVDETANVSRLTIMALVFVPLAYVSSLFSMNEKLGPGGPLFWVYFVVALPVTITVVLVARPPLNIVKKAAGHIRWPRRRWAERVRVADEKHVKAECSWTPDGTSSASV